MRNEQIRYPHLPPSRAPQRSAKPSPIHSGAEDFQKPSPILSRAEGKESVGIGVQVESSERHDEEVDFMLEGDEEAGDGVDFHDAVIVR